MMYGWHVNEAEHVRRILRLFMPYLGQRRRAKALEALEVGKNIRPHNQKATHCSHGHEFTADNTIHEKINRTLTDGQVMDYTARRCRICRTASSRRRGRRRIGWSEERLAAVEAVETRAKPG
jgi:hypothetical protein